jgi:hypothetical protein
LIFAKIGDIIQSMITLDKRRYVGGYLIGVPDFIADDWIRKRLESAIMDINAELSEVIKWNAALMSDEGLDEWIKQGHYLAPIVRAKVYGSKIENRQRIWLGNGISFGFYDHPERPVFMRGSLNILIAKYSHTEPHIGNGWAKMVAKRYLRRIKYSCFDPEKYDADITPIANSLHKKFHLSHTFDIRRGFHFQVGKLYDKYFYWKNGQHFEEQKSLPSMIERRLEYRKQRSKGKRVPTFATGLTKRNADHEAAAYDALVELGVNFEPVPGEKE